MDYLGNPINSGGFPNPANEELNMGNFKITNLKDGTSPKDAINLSQLTTYNPFNQSLNTTDSVQFAGVNMNGNWNIPNTQPASQADTNQYVLAAQGGLIIPNYSTLDPGAPFVSILFSRPSLPTDLSFQLTVPNLVPISYLDLCESFKQQFNNQVPAQYIGQMAMTGCDFLLVGSTYRFRCTCVNFAYPAFPFTANSYTLVGRTGPDTLRSNLGIWDDASNLYGQIVQGSQGIALTVTVAWSAASGTQPITNGAPFTYSIPNQKWVLTSPYSTPNFANTLTFDDTQYAIVQNGVARVSSTAFQTYLSAPNGITNFAMSNSGIGVVVDTVPRFSALSGGATTIKSFDDTMTLTLASNSLTASTDTTRLAIDTAKSSMFSPDGLYSLYSSNSGASLVYNGTARLGVGSVNNYQYSPDYQTTMTMTNTDITMTQNGFTKFLMNETPLIGTSLWGPSGSGRIELLTTRINLRQNSVNRFVINNAETYSFSPSLLNYSYKSNTELASFFNSVNRFSIGSTSSILKSPSTNSNFTLTDASTELYVASSLRFASDATETKILSPDINVSILMDSAIRLEATINSFALLTDTLYQCTLGTINRFYADMFKTTLNYNNTNYMSISSSSLDLVKNNVVRATVADNFTNTYSPSNIMNTNQADASYTISGGGATGPRLIMTPTDLSFNLNNITRIHSDASHSQLISPDGLQAVEANNTGIQINLGSNNYKLPTTRGTVGQVLTYSGVNTTWASVGVTPGTAINSGWGFLPMSSITATATAATRAFYYISMVPMNTVITGVKAYINAPGSDFINCAIYRGKNLVAGSTLVMTSGRVTVASVCDANNYMTLPLILQAGQSNVFTTGEYVTIAYHSSGATLVMYICAATPANLGISYLSTACYAASATPVFPANLSLIAQSTTNTIRTHMEFY